MTLSEQPAPDRPTSWLPAPPYLQVPPRGSFPGPPAATRPQTLPFHELAWENFERLCLCLLQRSTDTAHVDVLDSARVTRLYGSRGQGQAGIDVYSRDPLVLGEAPAARRYSCLQARRVQRVTKTALAAAVRDFQKGIWAPQSRRFIYATSLPGVATDLSEEIEKQSEILAKADIEFELWDAEELSTQLKQLPMVVDDFFGRPWVDLFCPDEASAKLGTRLDCDQTTELRLQLRRLYEAVFAVADTGLVALRLRAQQTSSLRDRFVTPNVLATLDAALITETPEKVEPDQVDAPLVHLINEASGGYRFARHGDEWRTPASTAAASVRRLQPDECVSAAVWLGKHSRQVIVGDAGAGKSTLLRVLVLDLLDDEPLWPDLSSRWGERLPVWLPFHFFTQRVADESGANASLSGALKAWFFQNDAAVVWPLVKAALEDERLLLVVDGLDEWVNDEAGRYAASALETFAATHSAAVVVSTRPYGLSHLALGAGWSYARIEPLSRAQQRTLSMRYFTDAVGNDEGGDAPTVARTVENFLREVDGSADLNQVAGLPLFLVLLIGLRLSTVGALPGRRFEVYDKALQLLIADHPARRRVAAAVVRPRLRLSDHHLRVVLAEAAFLAQKRGDISAIEMPILRQDVVQALRDRDTLALELADATAVADQVLDVAEGELGVLVRKGPGAFGFLHRMLQDQLTAEHITDRMTTEQQCAVLSAHACDARWRDVVLGVLWRVQRPHELRALKATIEGLVSDKPEGLLTREILAEAACGQFGLPGADARRIAERLLETVETHTYVPHRTRLLDAILPGLDNPTVADVIEDAMRRWTLAVKRPSGYLLWRLAALVPDHRTSDTVVQVLLRGLSNSGADVAYGAAIAIAARVSRPEYDEPDERDALRAGLLSVLRNPASGQAQAAALAALLLEWPDDPVMVAALAEARASTDHGVKVVALAYVLGVLRLGMGQAERPNPDLVSTPPPITEVERDWLLHRMEYHEASDVHGELQLAAIIRAAGNEERALDFCIKGIDLRSGPSLDILWAVALRAFPNDERFVGTLCRHLRTDEHPWMLLRADNSTLHHMALAYRPGTEHHQAIADAIEDHLRSFNKPHRATELPVFAAIDRGPVIRETLLRHVREGGFPHWASRALVDNFAADQTVLDELRSLLLGDPGKASAVANAASVVLGPANTVPWAIELLRRINAENSHDVKRDIVVRALLEAWTDCGETISAEELAAIVLPLLPSEPDWFGDTRYEVATTLYPASAAAELLDQLSQIQNRETSAFLHAYVAEPELALPFVTEARILVCALSPSSRRQICDHLRTRRVRPQLTMELTRHWADEIDESTKSVASLTYHSALALAREQGEIGEDTWQAAREWLKSQAGIYGPDHESRRRAAWVGMCTLRDWSMVKDVFERIGNTVPVAVGLEDPLRGADLALLTAIAETWPQLRVAFGDQLLERLSGPRGTGSVTPWGPLALVAGSNQMLLDELQEAVAADPGLLENDSILLWFATRPNASVEAIASALVERLPARNNGRGVAAYLLSRPETAGLDPATTVRLVEEQAGAGYGGGWGNAALEVLAFLAPDHKMVREEWGRYRALIHAEDKDEQDRYLEPHPRTYLAVAYAAVEKSEFLWLLSRDLHLMNESAETFFDEAFVYAVSHRIARDLDVKSLVESVLLDTDTSSSGAAVLASLLAAAAPVDELLSSQCRARLDELDDVPLVPIVRDHVVGADVPATIVFTRISDPLAASLTYRGDQRPG
jgi:hypothetical protein